MVNTGNEPKKIIVGWLTCKPGKRDELMSFVLPYISKCLEEKGCEFFEMNPSVQDPDTITLAECFADRKAHEIHLQSDTFQAFWKELAVHCVEGRFLNILSPYRTG